MLLVTHNGRSFKLAETFSEATALIFGTLSKMSGKPYSLEHPVSGPTIVTSRPSYARQHPVHGTTRRHAGIDFGVRPRGSQYAARAVIDGKVVYSGVMGGYGNVVVIEDDTWCYLYAHLANRAVSVGQSVKLGQPLGTVGMSGTATGVHLHYEIRPAGQWNIKATDRTVARMLEYLKIRGL